MQSSSAFHVAHPQSLRAAIPVDYLRCAVPTHMGGLGGGPEELGLLMRSLCAQSLSAGVLFWCQRTAIEFLVQSFNAALREHLLPDLLSFQRAATTPLSLDAPALTAQDGARGLRLSGWVQSVANAQADGVSLIVPVHMPAPTPGSAGWAVLQSEEDGVHLEPGTLRVASNNAEQEEAVDELDIDYGGDTIEIGFNVTYLIDALANMGQDMVKIDLADGNSSALMTIPDNESFKYVVMPMRI